MGQAKQRGTREQRKAEAIERNEAARIERERITQERRIAEYKRRQAEIEAREPQSPVQGEASVHERAFDGGRYRNMTKTIVLATLLAGGGYIK